MTGAAARRPLLFASLQGWGIGWLQGDAVAALILAAIAIPEQLATARLVGVPPVTGLVVFAAGTLAFAAFGTNRFISVGADSTIAPIMAAALLTLAAAGGPHLASLAALLAIMVGLVLLLAGLLRAGWIAELLSVPVTTGFLAGISVNIIVGQLPGILGVPGTQGNVARQLLGLAEVLPQARPWPVLIGLGVLGCALLAERISDRIPGALIGLLASGVAVAALGLQARGVAVIGALPLALPHAAPALPRWGDVTALLPTALIVALVCIMQTAAVLQSFADAEPSDGREDVSRDLVGLGLGCVLAGGLGGFAANSSPPRTALVAESGGRSQLAGVLAVAVVGIVVAVAAGAFAYVPAAALGGVLVFVALRIFRLRTMRRIAREGGPEIWLVVASFVLVLLLPVQTGVALAVLLSLALSITMTARPACAELRRVPGTTVWWSATDEAASGERLPGILVFAPGAPITFTNAAYVRARLDAAVAAQPLPCRLVVIEANGVIDIDYTGAQVLKGAIAALRARGIDVALARLASDRAHRAAKRSGLLAALAPGHVFLTVGEAVQRLGRA
jgi:MFS superfamily sulfate permease-like transporter